MIKYSIQTIYKNTLTMIKLASIWTNWFWDELALVWINSYTITTCPRHPGCKQQIDTTWDELVSDKVDSERIDLPVTSNAS